MPAKAGTRTEQGGLGLADEQAEVGALGRGALEGEQFLALAAVDPAHRARAFVGILAELGRIHVAEIHHESLAEVARDELGHLARKGEDGADRVAGEQPLDEGAQLRAVEQAEGNRLARDQRERAGGGLAAGPHLDMGFAEPAAERGLERRQVRGVRFVVRKAGEVDPAERREMLEQVPRADLVAPVGRKGDAVGEEEDVLHPRPRAIGGPIRLASQSGSRCQAAIRKR